VRTPYASLQQLYDLGLSARAFQSIARPFDSVNAATGAISLKAHGLSADDVITFEVSQGGTLPDGIAEATTYTPIPVSADIFKVRNPAGVAAVYGARNFASSMTTTTATLASGAAPDGVYSIAVVVTQSGPVGSYAWKYQVSEDGGATWGAEQTISPTATSLTIHGVTVNFTNGQGQVATQGYGFSFETYQITAGVSAGQPFTFADAGDGWAVAIDPERRLLAHLAETASEIDENLTAEEPPILPDPVTGEYPPTLVGLNARMAARSAVNSLAFDNAEFRVAVDALEAKRAADEKMLEVWRGGKPMLPRPTDQTTVAENSARASSDRSATDWNTGVL
jgi:hypothetical protein